MCRCVTSLKLQLCAVAIVCTTLLEAMCVFLPVLAIGLFATPADARLFDSARMSAHERHLAEVSTVLTTGCSITAAGACASTQATCLNSLGDRTQVRCHSCAANCSY